MEFLTTAWNAVLYYPILNTLIVLYLIGFHNLGVAIILLTIAIRFAVLPLYKSQMEGASMLQEMKPELDKIQKKYKKDPMTLQKKQAEVYKKYNYNPVGCFSSFFLNLLVLIALYMAVKNFSEGSLDGIYPFVLDLFQLKKVVVDTKFFGMDLAATYTGEAVKYGYFSLIAIPHLVVALLVGLSQYVSMRFVAGSKPKKVTPKATEQTDMPNMEEMTKSINSSTMLTMPVMYAYFSATWPTVLGFYWIIGALIQVVQQYIIGDRAFIVQKIKIRWQEFIKRQPKSDI